MFVSFYKSNKEIIKPSLWLYSGIKIKLSKYHQWIDINDYPSGSVMVASYYNFHASIGKIRKFYKTDARGIKFSGLIAAAEEAGSNEVSALKKRGDKLIQPEVIGEIFQQGTP
jgi:hypothetical protein